MRLEGQIFLTKCRNFFIHNLYFFVSFYLFIHLLHILFRKCKILLIIKPMKRFACWIVNAICEHLRQYTLGACCCFFFKYSFEKGNKACSTIIGQQLYFTILYWEFKNSQNHGPNTLLVCAYLHNSGILLSIKIRHSDILIKKGIQLVWKVYTC